jgi:hypothetical protein
MARNISTQLQDAASAKVVFPIIFVEAEFDSSTVRMWSGVGDLSWDAKTWTGGGSLLNVSSIEESTEVKAIGTRVSLSGIPSELLSLALQEDYQGRNLRVYLGAFTNENTFLLKQDGSILLKEDGGKLIAVDEQDIVAEPITIFSGRMDVMTISEGGDTSTIEVTVENRLIDFERTRERRYTSEDQKIDYPNDKGFEFVSSIQDTEIVWGRV